MAMRRYRREWGGIMRTRIVAVAMTAIIGGSTHAWAADIYVDAAAAAGGDGSAGMPFQDVQAGLDLAQPGDVVHVAPGMYPAISTVRAGTEEMRISVVADSRRTAIISGPGTALQYAHSGCVLIVAGSRTPGRPRGTMRDRKVLGRASRAR